MVDHVSLNRETGSSLNRERRRKASIESHLLATRVEEVSNPRVELSLDVIDREFGEQGRMPDCIQSLRYVQRDSPELMSDIDGLHPFFGELKQFVQCGVTWYLQLAAACKLVERLSMYSMCCLERHQSDHLK